MVGDTKGITTDYKRMADGNREIPLSACPSFIEEQFYGGGSSQPTEDDKLFLQQMTESLDEQAEKIFKGKRRPAKKKPATKSDKIRKFESEHKTVEYFYPAVNTDGDFSVLNQRFHISEACIQYAPKSVGDDVLYDMDKVIAVLCKDLRTTCLYMRFFDMNFDPIDDHVSPCQI